MAAEIAESPAEAAASGPAASTSEAVAARATGGPAPAIEPEVARGWIVGFDGWWSHEALCSLVASALVPLPSGSWRLVQRPPHWPALPTDFVAIEVTVAPDAADAVEGQARELLLSQAGRLSTARTRVRGVWPRRWYNPPSPPPPPPRPEKSSRRGRQEEEPPSVERQPLWIHGKRIYGWVNAESISPIPMCKRLQKGK